MEDEGAAILPTDLWVEVKKLGAHFTGLLNDYDDGKGISTDKFSDMVGSETKVALLGRATIGVDELTDESINLFSKQEDYEGLVNIKPSYFAKLHKKKNAKKDTM